MKKLLTITAVGALMFASTNANASGFFIKEQSVSGMGNAFAGATAGAEDISYSFWNIAGLTQHEGTQMNGNITFLHSTIEADAPRTNLQENNVIPFAEIPAFYASHQINENVFAGLSITAPFGLVTDYDNNFAGLAGAQDTLSDLMTVNISPSVAIKATCNLSLGMGLNIQYIDATLKSSIGSGANGLKYAGDTADIGYTLGALYEFSPRTRVGAAYRSEITHKLKGKASSTIAAYNTNIDAELTTPEILTFGVYHDINSKWAVMAEAQRTGWSSFDTLVINHANGTPSAVTPENWKDVWFYSVGANYKLNNKTKLRFGVAYDNNPVSDQWRTMRIPDSDRIWYSTGVEYKYSDNITLNAGYTFVYAEVANIDHGGNNVDYTGNIHLLGVGFNYNF